MENFALLITTWLILLFGILATSSNWDGKPRSCVEVRDKQGNTKSGFYGLYDATNKIYTTYCDLETEPSFAWTLIESMSLASAQTNAFRKKFYLNAPSNECSPNWAKFRLSKSRMLSIKAAKGSTYFRATCNFNARIHSKNSISVGHHRDYMRVAFCNYGYLFQNINAWNCAKMDYINIRGYSCRECGIALYVGNGYHSMVDLAYTTGKCDRFKVPDRVNSEYVFGDYRNLNPKFSCASSPSSTTNWWLGGPIVG